MAAQRQSAYVAVTRALLTAGATLALARVFAQTSWLAATFVAAALPAAVFFVAERRRVHALVTLGALAVVGAWLAVLVDDPSGTFAGIPTGSAIANAMHDLARAPHVLRSAVVPVDPVGAALMLAVVATFVASAVAELTARRLEAPLGAIGPSVALYVAISALGAGRWAPTTACYAVTVGAYLLAVHHAELEARRTWFHAAQRRRSQLLTGGAVAGALVVAAAVVVGPGVPGARSSAWIRYRSLGSGSGSSILNVTSPLVSVGSKLTGRNATDEVFTVSTSEPDGDYWRVIALDQFQNDGWGLNSDQRRASGLPGPTGAPGARIVQQEFHLGAAIDARWLPAEYRPVHVDLAGAQVLPGSTSLFLDQPLSGLDYRVTSEIVTPSKPVLESVTFDDLAPMAADIALPDGFSERARQFAQVVTRDARAPYDKAIALMNVFHSAPFVYDQSVDLGTSANALEKFLFQTHRGFCEQYAAAFAELARSIGLPTRVAVGYQPGRKGADGLWHVQEKDAHAWPEVWLGSAIGWYRFEPTPSRTDPITHLGGGAQGAGATSTTTSTTAPGASTPTSASSAPTTLPAQLQTPPPSARPGGSDTRHNVLTGLAVAAIALAALLVALMGAVAFGAGYRTRKRRHHPDPRRRVLGAWTEALERLAAAGVARRPATTSLEFALRQAPALGAGAAGPPLMDLARLHTSALYAPDPPSDADADAAWAEVDAIAGALRGSVPRLRRWRVRWTSGLPARRRSRSRPDDQA